MYRDKSKLLDQLREALRLKHYSQKTEKSYVYWGRHFILFHNKRHPQGMETPETQSFLNYSVQVLFFPNSTKAGGRPRPPMVWELAKFYQQSGNTEFVPALQCAPIRWNDSFCYN